MGGWHARASPVIETLMKIRFWLLPKKVTGRHGMAIFFLLLFSLRPLLLLVVVRRRCGAGNQWFPNLRVGRWPVLASGFPGRLDRIMLMAAQ